MYQWFTRKSLGLSETVATTLERLGVLLIPPIKPGQVQRWEKGSTKDVPQVNPIRGLALDLRTLNLAPVLMRSVRVIFPPCRAC